MLDYSINEIKNITNKIKESLKKQKNFIGKKICNIY